MNIYLISILLFLMSCKNDQPKIRNTEKEKNEQKILSSQNLNFKNVMELNKTDAIRNYGNPIKNEIDELKNMQGEFYGELENTVTKEEKKKNIIIHELTWEKDNLRYITIWYEKKTDKFMPRAKLIWYKDAEF